MAAVTLKDIAREANLSATTVSQVLNGRRLNHASPRSRKLVLDIAQKLNYRPNLSARQLVTRKNNIVGILIDSMSPLLFREVLVELERFAFANGLRLQVGMAHDNLQAIKNYIDDFLGSGVRSVICAAHTYPEFGSSIPELLKDFDRVVFLEKPVTGSSFPYVASDHYRNHYTAVTRMLKHGYRRICCLRQDYHDCAFTASYQGFKQAFIDFGESWQEEFWQSCSNWRVSPSRASAMRERFVDDLRSILAKKPEVIILDSDREMLMALRLLRTMSLRVPEDVCLFSAESSPYAADMTPSLAGFQYRPEVIAERIFASLEKQGGGDAVIAHELVTAMIFPGESCPL